MSEWSLMSRQHYECNSKEVKFRDEVEFRAYWKIEIQSKLELNSVPKLWSELEDRYPKLAKAEFRDGVNFRASLLIKI
jgi:hypothetical protein